MKLAVYIALTPYNLKLEVNTNTIYSMSGSVHKDNLTSGEIAFIFKGNNINHAPDRARITCLMFKYGVMKVRVGYL